jgi:hypothetical protein
VSPVKYELGFYISEDAILHSHRRENLKSYILLLFILNHYMSQHNWPSSCVQRQEITRSFTFKTKMKHEFRNIRTSFGETLPDQRYINTETHIVS